MNKLMKYFIFQGWMSYLIAAGLLLFSSGFLLNRSIIPEHSRCTNCKDIGKCDAEQVLKDPQKAATICLEPRSRIVILLVDALWYEFTQWHNESDVKSSYHQNKLPIIHQLLQQYPLQSRLYKFMADPPTTTMQRLQGLTTGSLPTFIDIGSNFASESIQEDNTIHQNNPNGVIFMGDDTWTNLFPGKFKRQFPSPSFNVWDLDSVDKEVQYRIFFELKKNDWSLLIAHILGIDHCGHRHGMHHPEMTRKLNDTNNLITEIVESLEPDMMLFVIGDHGMTQTGDHGGDSNDEIEAAMFVYSKTLLLQSSSFVNKKDTVNQVDLVPTLASILGTPIPFSNLGSVILDCLPNNIPDQLWYPLHSVWRNIVQTKTYIDAFTMHMDSFSIEKLQNLDKMFNDLSEQIKHVHKVEEFQSYFKNSNVYLESIKTSCSEIWIKFDSNLMFKGLVLVFCTLFCFYIFVTGIPENQISIIFDSSFLLFSTMANSITILIIVCLYFFNILEGLRNTIFFYTGAVSMFLLFLLIAQNWDIISMSWYNLSRTKNINFTVRGILIAIVGGLFSNSFIIEEDRVLLFLLITLLCVFTLNARNEESPESIERKTKNTPKYSLKSNTRTTIIVIGFIACVAVRLSSYFWRCREEHLGRTCSDMFIGKAGSLISSNLERILVLGTLIILALYITIVRLWLRNCGNLSGYSLTVITIQYFPVVIGVCTGFYWVLQRLPKFTKTKFVLSSQLNNLPKIVYILNLIAILILYCRPLSIFLLPKKKESINVFSGENLVPRLFEKIKESICSKKSEIDETPVVYGLGTAYSATFISLSLFLVLLYALLLGDMFLPSVFLMFVISTAILVLSAVERYKRANDLAELMDVSTTAIVCWFLTAEYFFYGTGHQASFVTIHWDAAFIGTIDPSYGNFLPAILIGINTFGSHIIMGITLPLLVIAPFTLYLVFPKLTKPKFFEGDLRRGELVLFERDTVFHTAVFTLSAKYILLHGIRTFSSMLSATIHCRHLMAWKIFAPKLIFGGIGFLVTAGSVLASLFMVLRINRQMEHLITRVTKGR